MGWVLLLSLAFDATRMFRPGGIFPVGWMRLVAQCSKQPLESRQEKGWGKICGIRDERGRTRKWQGLVAF